MACDVVWAEIAAAFAAERPAREALERLGVEFSTVDAGAALAAGRAFKEYRRRGGTRQRVVPDFLVGAHAQAQADRLLTRDRGFYRSYFQTVTVVDPASATR